MIIFCLPEFREWLDYGDNFVHVVHLLSFHRLLDNWFLPFGMVHDGRAVLRALVTSLPVECGGVMDFPVDSQDFLERNQLWVVCHLDYFGVSGSSRLYILISRVFEISSCISRDALDNTSRVKEGSFNAPEAAASESALLERLREFVVSPLVV